MHDYLNRTQLKSIGIKLGISEQATSRLVESLVIGEASVKPTRVNSTRVNSLNNSEATAAGPTSDTVEEKFPLEEKGGASSGKFFQLGLTLSRLEISAINLSQSEKAQKLTTLIVQALSEYSSVCPLVFNWIIRGDFNPQRLPDTLKIEHLLHASRTAARLRAKIAKGLQV